MPKYEILKTAFKIFQFIVFLALLLYMILKDRTSHSLNTWIITGYLITISLIIVLTTITNRVYFWFPFLQKGYKLALTVLLMSAFAFDEKILSLQTIAMFVLMGVSLVFLVVSVFFGKEDRINDIVISRDFEQQIKSSITAGSQMKKYNLEEAGIKDDKDDGKGDVTINTSVNNKTKSYLF